MNLHKLHLCGKPVKLHTPVIYIFVVLFLLGTDVPDSAEKYESAYLVHYTTYSDLQIERYADQYSTLALTGYSVTKRGNIVIDRPKVHKKISSLVDRNRFLPVMTLQSPAAGKVVLKNEVGRNILAQNLLLYLKEEDLNQIQFDFEYMPGEFADEYALLMKELKEKRADLFISVCIAPPLDTDKRYAPFFDVTLLDPFVDEFMLMAYDYFGPLRSNGPVTDIGWVRKNLDYLVKRVSPAKIVLGAPLYGYYWDKKGEIKVMTERVFYRRFQNNEAVRQQGGTVSIKNAKERGYSSLSVGDQETVRLYKALVREYGLKGMAYWRLGFER